MKTIAAYIFILVLLAPSGSMAQDLSDQDVEVVHEVCTSALEELLASARSNARIVSIAEPVSSPATFEEYIGDIHPAVRRSSQDALRRVPPAAVLRANAETAFTVERPLRHSAMIVLDESFRSSVSGTNRVMCSVYAAPSRPPSEFEPYGRRVRINEASVFHHYLLNLPL